MRALFLSTTLVLAGSAVSLTAQAKHADAPAAEKPADTQAPSSDAYSYASEGRRDPFLSLIGTGGGDPKGAPKRTDGPPTFLVGEISVRGIMQTRATLVAMVQGPDNKTYLVHQGDKLADGVIKTVTPQGLVVVQDISDPLSIQKQREVRKLLRSLEDAKEQP
jgi:Tfp pilus assembly protein PilP